MRRVRVGLAQVNPTVGAIEANARLVVDWMGRARSAGCDLVAFPELTLTGYPPEDLLFKPAFIEANLRALADVTKQSKGLTAVLGYVDKRDDIFNAAAVLHDGTHAGTYHKQYLPNYGVFDENRYFQSGTESPIFVVGDVAMAANICEDIWYPTGPTTRQALAGAELIVTINASPYHVGKAQFREKMLATRASDDLVCLAFVNTVGDRTSWSSTGTPSSSTRRVSASRGAGLRGRPGDHGHRSRPGVPGAPARLTATEGEAPGRREHAAHLAPRPCPAREGQAARARGGGARAGGGDLPRPRPRHARLRDEERLQARGDRPLGRHRLVDRGRGGRGCAGRGQCHRGDHALARFPPRAPGTTRFASPRTSASICSACPSRACSRRTSGCSRGRSRGSRRT